MKTARNALAVSLLSSMLAATDVSAQYTVAEVAGTVKDQSGAVLPGVTVTATEREKGTTRTTTTLENGAYTMKSLGPGIYDFKVELPGFATTVRERIELSVGQSLWLDFTMGLSNVAQTIIVEAQVPLVDPTRSDFSVVVSKQQIEGLPINGRNWLDLSILAPGVNSVGGIPTAGAGPIAYTKIFVDGTEMNNQCCASGTRTILSQDALAEVQVIANRFDARYGHSGSLIVNASTKSGANEFHGSFLFFVRDDALNAKDFFTNRVEPFHNTQIGGSLGGPILRDKAHFYFNFERQNQPQTSSANTGLPTFDAPVKSAQNRKFWFGRVDYQLNAANHVHTRVAVFNERLTNFGVSGRNAIQRGFDNPTDTVSVTTNWTSVISAKALNEIRMSFIHNAFDQRPLVNSPEYNFPSVVIGSPFNQPNGFTDRVFHFRDDFSYYKPTSHGGHDIRFGGEVQHTKESGVFGLLSRGQFFFNSNPPNLATCCLGLDPSNWDRSQFPAPINYIQALGNFDIDVAKTIMSAYFQDDWRMRPRFTLNLGVRYDLEIGSLGESFRTSFLKPNKRDTNNIQPRLGFAYDVTAKKRTIVRGGVGVYTDQVFLNVTVDQQIFNGESLVVANVLNDGRRDFLQNPLGGRTFRDFLSGAAPADIRPLADDMVQPWNINASIGAAHQVGNNLSVAFDYVYSKSLNRLIELDKNLFCCTSDGFPLPVRDFGRPFGQFARIREIGSAGKGKYDGLQFAVNGRFAGRHQFGATYLLSWNKDDTDGPFRPPNNPFNLQDEYAESLLSQRHRFVANWVVMLPYQIALNGVFYADSGQTLPVKTGGRDVNGDGTELDDRPFCTPSIPGCVKLGIPTGQLIPRNPWKSDPVARVDLRLSRQLRLWHRVRAEGIVEWFNLFNRRNYDPATYSTNVFVAQFGQPGRSTALPYQPRQMQFGVRLTF